MNISLGLERLKKSILSLKWYEWLMIGIMVAVAIFSVVTSAMHHNPLLELISGHEVLDKTPLWLAAINFISAIAGIMCIFLCAKASIGNFAFGIINTLTYTTALIYKCANGKPYLATVFLEVLVYLPVGIISWIIWARHRDRVEGCDHLTQAKKLNWWQDLVVAGIVLGVTTAVHFGLSKIPYLVDNSWYTIGGTGTLGQVLGWLDSAVFAIGLVAIILQMIRYREQYVLWLIQDVVVVTQFTLPLFMGVENFDPVYWTKKMIYLIMAVIGLINWIKLQKMHNQTNE